MNSFEFTYSTSNFFESKYLLKQLSAYQHTQLKRYSAWKIYQTHLVWRIYSHMISIVLDIGRTTAGFLYSVCRWKSNEHMFLLCLKNSVSVVYTSIMKYGNSMWRISKTKKNQTFIKHYVLIYQAHFIFLVFDLWQ